MTGSLALAGMDTALATAASEAAGNADLRDAALRGLARAADRGDPVLADQAEAVLAQLDVSDPEGALLVRIYRAFDLASAAYRFGGSGEEPGDVLALAALHAAVRDSKAISFDYVDVQSNRTTRTVLPLAIVHPPQGIKLLAWCEKRQDHRQFFVRAVSKIKVHEKRFNKRRPLLLRQLADNAAERRLEG